MKQLDITYFWPLTEQIRLDLDYTPCERYNQEKIHRSIANSVTSGTILTSNGSSLSFTGTVMNDPRLVIYPESTPITIRTKQKPSILARWVYKILGAKWERAS